MTRTKKNPYDTPVNRQLVSMMTDEVLIETLWASKSSDERIFLNNQLAMRNEVQGCGCWNATHLGRCIHTSR